MKNVVSVPNNELMDALSWNYNDSYGNHPLKDLIKNNILEDYANGIKFCDLKVFPGDLKWISGGIAKEWQNGDILNIGDVIKVLNENGESILYYDEFKEHPYYFKVIDIRTIYSGQILLELKLMECKFVSDI